MRWQTLRQKIQAASIDVADEVRARPILFVDSKRQVISQITPDDNLLAQYRVSTSRYGLGQQQDSLKTPTGIHCIAEKFGQDEVEGRVFKGRQPMEQICLPEDHNTDDDVITSRILWLEGLQQGINRGGNVDTRQRYIYIHGTADEAHIGQPASIGCIRMINRDVIELFERVKVNDLVIIE